MKAVQASDGKSHGVYGDMKRLMLDIYKVFFCFVKAYWREMLPQACGMRRNREMSKANRKIARDELSEALRYLPVLPPVPNDIFVYPVHFHPERDNSLLLLEERLMLDLLPLHQYLNFVHHKLSPRKREFLMVDEAERRRTFLVDWPYTDNLSGEEMARAGFFFCGNGDRVQCPFCRGILHRWEAQDNPRSEHARLFPFCMFVNGSEECGNIEYRADSLLNHSLRNIKDLRRSPPSTLAMTCRQFGVVEKQAVMPSYADFSCRMATFDKWLFDFMVTRQSLAEAGFICSGFDDKVKCFSCGLEIREWQMDDDPMEEHARSSGRCNFLRLLKGDSYIAQIQATPAEEIMTERRKRKHEKEKIQEMNAMEELCLKLGHEKEAIDEVMLLNDGVPYDTPRDMIEMLYKVEERQLPASDHMEKRSPTTTQEEGNECNISAKQATDDGPSMLKGLTGQQWKLTCKLCYLRTGQCVQASYMGLPCGHVIYCDNCHEEVMAEWSSSTSYIVHCPYYGCGQPFNGLMKFYLN